MEGMKTMLNRTRSTVSFFAVVAIALFLTAFLSMALRPILGQMVGSVVSLGAGIAVARIMWN